jgi:hypothetical protein
MLVIGGKNYFHPSYGLRKSKEKWLISFEQTVFNATFELKRAICANIEFTNDQTYNKQIVAFCDYPDASSHVA